MYNVNVPDITDIICDVGYTVKETTVGPVSLVVASIAVIPLIEVDSITLLCDVSVPSIILDVQTDTVTVDSLEIDAYSLPPIPDDAYVITTADDVIVTQLEMYTPLAVTVDDVVYEIALPSTLLSVNVTAPSIIAEGLESAVNLLGIEPSWTPMEALVSLVTNRYLDIVSVSEMVAVGLVFSRSYSDSVLTNDILFISADLARNFSADSLGTSETFRFTTTKLTEEALGAVDYLKLAIAKKRVDVVSPSDKLHKTFEKIPSDALTSSDRLYKALTKVVHDTVVSSELVSGVARVPPQSEGAAATDMLARHFSKSAMDAAVASDAVYRSVEKSNYDTAAVVEVIKYSLMSSQLDNVTSSEAGVIQISDYFAEDYLETPVDYVSTVATTF
jgi:hypothetical protein